MKKITFEPLSAGVWKGHTGPASEGVLSIVGNPSRLSREDSSSQPFPLEGIWEEETGSLSVVCIPYDRQEKLYGPGLNFDSIVKNYDVLHLHVDHYHGQDNGRTHLPVPFYVSDRGYGILIDTPEYISFYMGGTVRADAQNPPKELNRGRGFWTATTPGELVEASFAGGADVYVFAGDTMLEVVSRYNLLCGGGALPPKWGLGFWQRTHIHAAEADVAEEIREFDEKGFHPDVIGLEPGWQSNSYPCTYEWDTERFPDPKQFIANCTEKNVRINLWENLFVSEKSELHDAIAPYCGSHKVWNGLVPDFTMKKAAELFAAHQDKNAVSLGVSGFKIDECDGFDNWLFPEHTRFPSGRSAAAVRTTMGILAQKLLYELYRGQNRRTYGLVRASAAGSSMMPFGIYNDCYSFKQFLTGIASSSFCGCLWVPEVRSAKTPEEWVRRFELCAFSPMLMLNAWSNGVKPWQFAKVTDLVRDIIGLRKKLLPYFYHAFYRYQQEGIPPFRAYCLDFPTLRKESCSELDHTENPYEQIELSEITDQYMAGDCLMVCPALPEESSRQVILPAGNWYDFYTGTFAGNGETITADCPLGRIPLFVKEGGMIPMLEEEELVVHCYGSAGTRLLYDDDGETFDYETGRCSLRSLHFERKDGAICGSVKLLHNGYPESQPKIRFAGGYLPD